jgi:metal-responsive CopG/Arc/MetJ family transcriptional regulator
MKVEIDDKLYARISRRAEETGFDSPEEYIDELLTTVLDELEEETDDIKEQLQDLGYID